MINTDRTGGTVLLFVRPANGVYLPPKVMRLKGKSTVEEIDVVKKDMPNFFVEAVTVADGKVYTRDARRSSSRRRSGCSTSRSSPSAERLQAGREGQGEAQADRLPRRAVRRLDGGGDLRQVGGVHLRRLQRAGDQGVLLEVAAAPPPADRDEPRRGLPATSIRPNDHRDERPRRLRRLGGRRDGRAAAGDGSGGLGELRRQAAAAWAARRRWRAAAGRADAGRWPRRRARWRQRDGRRRADGHGRRRGQRGKAATARRRRPAAGPAHRPHQVRRHRPLGRRPDDRQGRHGRGRAQHAREPHHLADQGLGHGPRHQGRRRRRPTWSPART